MDRLKDYIGFAVWFAGLGYIAMWPLASSGDSGVPFGATILCADGPLRVADVLCHLPHPLPLPLPFHVLGALSTSIVAVLFFRLALNRSRRVRSLASASQRMAPMPESPPARLPDSILQSLPRVKPRSHFGLRGVRR